MKSAVIYDGRVICEGDLPENSKTISVAHRLKDGALIRVDDHAVSQCPCQLDAAKESGAHLIECRVNGVDCYEIKRLSARDAFKGTGWFGQ